MTIIQELHTTETLAPRDAKTRAWNIGDAAYDDNGRQYVHFAPWVDDGDIQPGDLVMCQTSETNSFKISFVVRRLEYGRCILREIGSDRTCDYSNERFIPIRGLTPTQLLEGDKYKFYIKISKAFALGDEFWYRFGGAEIEDGKATIWVRERYGGLKRPSKPFPIAIEWSPETTAEDILAALRTGGYGTREFELVKQEAGE